MLIVRQRKGVILILVLAALTPLPLLATASAILQTHKEYRNWEGRYWGRDENKNGREDEGEAAVTEASSSTRRCSMM